MAKDAYQRFIGSMSIGYDQWHDGEGYDLPALDELSDGERKDVEKVLIPRALNDWRDLEALERLGTPNAIKAIHRARTSKDPEILLHALKVGPAPSDEEWDKALVYAISKVEPFAGLSLTINCALEHPSLKVRSALWAQVESPASTIAFHCAEALTVIAKVTKSLYSDKYRPLFLRFVGPCGTESELADRAMALDELKVLCKRIL